MLRKNKNKKSMSHKKTFFGVLLVVVLVGGAATFALTQAKEVIDVDLNIFSDTDFKNTNTVDILSGDFIGTTNFATISVPGSRERQFVVALSNQTEPTIKIFNGAGALVRSWIPFELGRLDAISLAVGDVDGDGLEEIVVGAGRGGTPQIRIFDDKGRTKFNNGFWGEDVGYTNGLEIALGDINNDNRKEIIVASAKNKKNIIKFFDYNGKEIEKSFSFNVVDDFVPAEIASIDYNQDGTSEILVGASSGNDGSVKIFDKSGTMLNEFNAYKNFIGGVNIATGKIDGQTVIVTGAGYGGGPHIRFFSLDGTKLVNELFSHNKKFLGGVNVLLSDINGDAVDELLVLPGQIQKQGTRYAIKYIDIDLSEQKLRYYQAGNLVDQYVISSGRSGMATPKGTFKIQNKNPRAYSAKYNLYMPYWMAFKGPYGLHELPEWANGYKEGQNHLGMKVSHGCVRMGVGHAAKLYNWAPIGTPVIIHD